MVTIPKPTLLLRSSVPGKIPTSGQLVYGQIAINPVDGKIFTVRQDGQTVVQLGVAPSDMSEVAFSGDYNDLLNIPPGSIPYVLPTAKTNELGGVKIGTGLIVDAEGLVNTNIVSVNGRGGAVVLQGVDVGIPNDLMDTGNNVLNLAYIPSSILGGMTYKSSYPLSGPALPAPVPGNVGWLYVSSEAGPVTLTGDAEPVVLQVGDWLISNGTKWEIIPDVSGVITSVNEQTGEVVITLSSLGASAVATSGSYTDLVNVPADFTPAAHTHPTTQITGLATVAATGDFNDLLNVPGGYTVANVAVSAEAEQFLALDVSYLFTRPAQFPSNFAGSVCQAELNGATTASVVIRKNGGQVGTIEIDGTTGTFTAVGVQNFVAGDKLTYHWNSLNIKSISINLQGTWL